MAKRRMPPPFQKKDKAASDDPKQTIAAGLDNAQRGDVPTAPQRRKTRGFPGNFPGKP